MRGGHAVIFVQENPIFRKKNHFFADFTAGIPQDSSEIWKGWQWRGRDSPVHKAQPVYTVSINVFSTREKSTTPSKNTSIVTAMDSQ